MNIRFKYYVILGMLSAFSLLQAQSVPKEILKVAVLASQNTVVAGGELGIALSIDILEPWHVYAPVGNDAFTIPIQVFMDDNEYVSKSSEWDYPKAEHLSVAGVKEPAAVYGGTLILKTRLHLDPSLRDTLKLSGKVYYQACDDTRCLIPEEVPFSLELPVVESMTSVTATNQHLFKDDGTVTKATAVSTLEDEGIAGMVNERGLLVTFILIFLGGLALNLTPCVYPLIPITISFFGGIDVGKGRTFWMALAYVLGIAITYSILGVVAALGGGLFGVWLTHPAVLISIALILVGLSLSMFGVYEFRLPTGLMTAAGQSKTGILGSLFMGLTLGIVAAPCVGPFVIGLLTYVAMLQSVTMGFFMFFTLAMGLGLPYLFLAMFSSRISSMPRSGAWMIGVRIIFGFVLVAMALYFLQPLLGSWGGPLMALFIVGAGIYLIMFDRSGEGARGFQYIKQTLAIAAIIGGTWMAVPSENAHVDGISWLHPSTEAELDVALNTNKPVMIDFYADWCIPCKEMDKLTFPDAQVIELSKAYTMVKIDMTHFDGDFEKAMQQRFEIKGVPSYVFLTSEGVERSDLRLTGYENAEDFSHRLKQGY